MALFEPQVLLVPRDDVVTRDVVDRRLGGLGRDGRILAVDQLLPRGAGDARQAPVPVAERRRHRVLLALDAVLRERRVLEDVEPDLERLVHVAHMDRRRRRRHASGQELHPLVNLIDGHRRRPAGPHHRSADGLEAELVLRLEERARADAAPATGALRELERQVLHAAPAAAPAAAAGHRRQQRRFEPGDVVVFRNVDDQPVRQRRPEVGRLRRLEVERGELPEELLGPRALSGRGGRRGDRGFRGRRRGWRRLGLGRLLPGRVEPGREQRRDDQKGQDSITHRHIPFSARLRHPAAGSLRAGRRTPKGAAAISRAPGHR